MKEYTFQDYMNEQAEEIKKFIWCKGVELHHNPIEDKTEDEWGIEWIEKYAVQFRETHKIMA